MGCSGPQPTIADEDAPGKQRHSTPHELRKRCDKKYQNSPVEERQFALVHGVPKAWIISV